MGSIFFNFARGKDNRPVEAFHERKSVGCEETYLENLNKESQVVISIISSRYRISCAHR